MSLRKQKQKQKQKLCEDNVRKLIIDQKKRWESPTKASVVKNEESAGLFIEETTWQSLKKLSTLVSVPRFYKESWWTLYPHYLIVFFFVPTKQKQENDIIQYPQRRCLRICLGSRRGLWHGTITELVRKEQLENSAIQTWLKSVTNSLEQST